jgi:TctA family transporter
MIEAPLRIAERFGVKIDKDIKDAINTAQLLIQTMRVATMWAHNLKAALIGTGIGIVMVAIGGLVSSRMTTNEDRRIER